MDGLLSIMFDEGELTNRTNQWLFHIQNIIKNNVIHPNNVTTLNIPEQGKFIICMTPTKSMNSQYASRCFVNSSFQVHF